MQTKYASLPGRSSQLWSRADLLSSDYAAGTAMTDHFTVLEKTPTTILIRGGDSPLTSPHGPRSSDCLFEVSAVLNKDRGYCEFGLKFVGFDGTDEGTKVAEGGPMTGYMLWAHKAYTKLWLESGLGNVKR